MPVEWRFSIDYTAAEGFCIRYWAQDETEQKRRAHQPSPAQL